jgi:hypothetical protein
LPSAIIFEGKVHQSTWYRIGIPSDWVIGLNENGWTNDELGYKWLIQIFDKHIRGRTVGTYYLLLLDSHGSYFSPEFDEFCKKNSIIWLCYPPYSTHLLQALDFGCFSILKNIYGRLIQEKAELGVFHIDKPDFLILYQQIHTITFVENTVKKVFEIVNIMLFNPVKILSRLKVKIPSPILQPQTLHLQGLEGQLSFKTPHNIAELDTQIEALQRYRTQAAYNQISPTDQALRYLVKGCQTAMYDVALLAEENKRLRTENDRQKKKRNVRCSYVARGGILAVEQGLQLAEERADSGEGSRARSGAAGRSDSQRLCSNCKLPGHNVRTCPGVKDSIHIII